MLPATAATAFAFPFPLCLAPPRALLSAAFMLGMGLAGLVGPADRWIMSLVPGESVLESPSAPLA